MKFAWGGALIMVQLIVIYLVAAFFLNLWPFDNTERAIEASDFNAYFYYPNGNEYYLGKVTGLPACQSTARSHAAYKNISNSNWSYICCRITSDSSCATKHR